MNSHKTADIQNNTDTVARQQTYLSVKKQWLDIKISLKKNIVARHQAYLSVQTQ